MTLIGKAAMVTGGAVGLGRSFARALGRSGAAVTIGDIRGGVMDTAACGWPEPVDHSQAEACPWRNERRRPGWVGLDLYDASKWALNGLTQRGRSRCASTEYG
jgi:NAD(P)-dependent dehydrogenase (short-subunit alcohol dehydrogenase family)